MAKIILVVDDDEMNLKMAEFILKQANYEVVKVTSGMEALLYLRDRDADLVLLDIEMPIMSGLKTYEIMKENKYLAGIPTMFLTASVDSDVVLEAGKLGAKDYVVKPFLAQELLKRVENALY